MFHALLFDIPHLFFENELPGMQFIPPYYAVISAAKVFGSRRFAIRRNKGWLILFVRGDYRENC